MPSTSLSTHERFTRMFAHLEADRIPIIDSPWADTIERWHREGMPTDVNFVDYFDLDHIVGIGIDTSPRYPSRRVEETDEYVIDETAWGVTLKNLKRTSVPQYLHFRIQDPDSWREAKARIIPTRDRVDWNRLQTHYRSWRECGWWIQGHPWFGFDATHSFVDMELLLEAMIEKPEWVVEMYNHCLDISLVLLDMVWEEGYTFSSIFWCDDMGYRGTQFFSVNMYRDLLKPIQQRAIEWAHAKGIKAHLHSCGNINRFVPELVEIGLDGLNPLEVKAGMDPVGLKQQFGDSLLLHGGINAVLWDDVEAIEAEVQRVVPAVKESGGYIFSSDHSVPSSISLEQFRYITDLAKKLGRYE